MVNKLWTNEEVKILEELWPRASSKELSSAFSSRSRHSLAVKAKKLGLKCVSRQIEHRFTKSWTKAKYDFLAITYPFNKTEDLVPIFATSLHSIHERARVIGIKKDVNFSCQRKGTLFPLLEDTPEAFYWMGFIFADGWISNTGQLVVQLSNKDEEHLEKLALFLQASVHSIKNLCSGYKNGTDYSRIAISHPQAATLIKEKFDYRERKTCNPPNLLFLYTKEKFISFFAGFIDGDGSFTTDGKVLRVEIHSSWLMQLSLFSTLLGNYLEEEPPSVSITGRGSSILSCGRRSLIRELSNSVRGLGLPVLERKWSRIK